MDIIDSLMQFGKFHNKMTSDKVNPWADNEHSWTHLVSAELVR
jgi:hypothetical protein